MNTKMGLKNSVFLNIAEQGNLRRNTYPKDIHIPQPTTANSLPQPHIPPFLPSNTLPPINLQTNPRHEPRLVTSQIQRRARNIARVAQSAHRYIEQELGPRLGRVLLARELLEESRARE